LIPDNEDPDSYLNKVGASAFRDFVNINKKDFLLFQIEVAIKEAETDSHKKAILVNQVAETISKINKPEDFTRRHDYIRQCSGLLKIDEAGLLALVTKLLREKISRKENKSTDQQAGFLEGQVNRPIPADDDSLMLLNRDEQQERAMVRSLLEFGLRSWDGNKRVADYMLEEFIDHDMIDNKHLLTIMERYTALYKEGLEPTSKTFLYQEDQELSALVVSILDFPYEVSPNWKDHYEGKIYTRDDLYKEEVLSTLNYLKLRKIKRLIEMNQKDLEKSLTSDEQLMCMQKHRHLKNMERKLLEIAGTVIVK